MILENKHEEKVIEVKVLEEYFKEFNKGTLSNDVLIEKSCVCDWIIFVKYFSNSTILVEILMCLMRLELSNDKEDKHVWIDPLIQWYSNENISISEINFGLSKNISQI